MKNSNFWNIVSNYGSKVWGLVSVFIFIPLYIKYLGVEAYGVIGFYSLLLGLLSFADGGLSSAIVKNFSSENSYSYKYSLLKTVENVYSKICVLIFVLVFLLAPLISRYWLTSETIPLDKLSYYIRLIGAGIAIQLISSLYYGSIFGLNYQVQANVIQVSWNIFKSLGVVVVLIVVSPTLEVFFIWQILCNIVYVLVIRYRAFMQLKKDSDNDLEIIFKKIPKEVLLYISGMLVIAIVSSINFQADKIVTSYTFSLKLYGYYNLASVLASSPMLVATPLALSVFPIFSNYSSISNEEKIKISFTKASTLINILIIIVSSIIIIYTKEVILLWTNSAIELQYLEDVVFLVRLLSVGFSLQSFQLLTFYLLLSKGVTKYNVYQGIIQVLVGVPLLVLFVKHIGLIGAGMPWVIINLGAFVFLSYVVFKYYTNLSFFKYFLKTYLFPLVSIISIFLLFYLIYVVTNFHFLYFVLISVVLSVFTIISISNKIKGVSIINLKRFIDLSNE